MDCFEMMVSEIIRLNSDEPLRTEQESCLYVEKLMLFGYNITKDVKWQNLLFIWMHGIIAIRIKFLWIRFIVKTGKPGHSNDDLCEWPIPKGQEAY